MVFTGMDSSWGKVADALQDLGPDPGDTLCLSQESLSGLTNLGATCYVNNVLQCLYMNRAFHTGVFAAEVELKNWQPVLYQLGLLFAQLHSEKKMAVDSAPFASTLELDNAVQQDGQEFLKLLFTLLERVLATLDCLWPKMLYQMCFMAPFLMSLSEHSLVQFDLDCQYLGDNFSRCLLNCDEGI